MLPEGALHPRVGRPAAANTTLKIDDYDYELPPELVAQEPAARRDASRLMLLPPGSGPVAEHRFADLPGLLEPGDLLVVNDARVLPARLRGRRASGGAVEALLLGPADDPQGRGRPCRRALVRPARKLAPGAHFEVVAGAGSRGDSTPAAVGAEPAPEGGAGSQEPAGTGLILEVVAEGDDGVRLLAFPVGCDVDDLMVAHGAMPLPPYIERRAGDPRAAMDRDRYQTVYARAAGAVAAPTAGLHFTEAVRGALRQRGIGWATLTLAVGPGTFQPVRVDDVRDHVMAAERYTIPRATLEATAAARRRGGRVIGVGTTVVRALEEQAHGGAAEGRATIFIVPGHEFRAVDGMITNFHLPRSTPLLMVAALAGRERLLSAYRVAVRQGFRFYSYGDAMLLLRRP